MRFRRGATGVATPDGTTEDLDEECQALLALTDPAAFAPLYLRYRPRVYRLCYRATGNATDAEDLTSQVFHKALARLGTFHGGSFEKWIVTITVNTIRDDRRTQRRHASLPELRHDPRPGPEEEAVRADDRARLHALLATLPDDQREVIELRLAGYTGAEIARMLGRSPEAVRKAQERALKRIARQLGLGGEPGDPDAGGRAR
jgi:RNA polymerase sigma-70 factor (ECF subfamily)